MTTIFSARSQSNWNHAIAGMLAFGAAISVSPLARADCTKDTDCKGDRVCTAGACTEPAPPIVRKLPDDGAEPALMPPVVVSPQSPDSAVTPAPAPAPAPRSRTRGDLPQDSGAGTRSTGIGLFVSGLVLDLIGGGMYIGGTQAKCSAYSGNVTVSAGSDVKRSSSDYAPCSTVWKIGIGTLIVGGLLTVVGLSVWVVGSSQGPVATARKRPVVPYVNVGLSGGEAGFRF